MLELDKGVEEKPRVFEGKFGYPITIGTKVLYIDYHKYTIEEGEVCHITDNSVFVDTGWGDDYGRRRVKHHLVCVELISMEAIKKKEDETDNS